jgi:hypothetical protein
MVVAISDFWDDPEAVIRAVSPLRARGSEVVLFQVLDPEELQPKIKGSVLLEDLESGTKMQVSADYAMREYKEKMGTHLEDLRQKAVAAGIEYFLCDTSKPLDQSLRHYLAARTGRL